MNSGRRKHLSSGSLTRSIFLRFFTALLLYSVALLLAFLVCYIIASSFTWSGRELLFAPLNFINRNRELVLICCWAVIAVVLFMYYWRQTLKFLDVMAEASEQLVSEDDELIRLPRELSWVEDRMNRVKQEAVRGARLARQSEQRKNDLIVYLAHDLKTPLTSVIGYLSLLSEEREISERLRGKYLSIALNKAERLEELINEFFEINRFNLSELTLEPGRVNLSRMLEQICSEFEPLLAEKDLKYRLEAGGDIEIKCDVNKMERVFDNLIRNAVGYSYEGSTIEISAVKEENGVRMRFVNSGDTIPKEKLGRIFEQFFRLDSSRSTKSGGAGLGLAIAREIVELHGGSITASSENERVEFEVFLPAVL